MYSTDQEKYKSSAKEVKDQLPIPMPLYEEIKKGNVDILLQAFYSRQIVLLKHIQKGSQQPNIVRWQACVEALQAACDFLNQYKLD